MLQDLALFQLFAPLDQDVAAVGLQPRAGIVFSVILLAVEELAEFLLVAEACGGLVLVDETWRVVAGYQLLLDAELPVAVAALEHGWDRRAQAV